MLIRVPQRLKTEQQYQALCVKDVIFVEYRTLEESRQTDVLFSEHALAFLLDGEKRLHTPSGDYVVRAGDALFIRRGCYGMSETFTDKHIYRSIIFFFNENLVRQFATEYGSLLQAPPVGDVQDFTVFPSSRRLQEAVQSVLPCFKDDAALLPHLVPLKLKELLLLLLQEDRQQQLKLLLYSLYANKKQSLQALVDQHFLKNLSLEEWAMLSGRSLSTFKRDFVTCFGTTPHQWLQQKKLEHARFLLLHTDKTVSEITYEIGLESVSHFAKIFAKKFGYTPGSRRTEIVTD